MFSQQLKASGKAGPVGGLHCSGYSPKRNLAGAPYGGRFFISSTDRSRYNSAAKEWEERKDSDLRDYWPKSEVPYGFMTHMNNGGIPNHGFTHWWKMFNPTQLSGPYTTFPRNTGERVRIVGDEAIHSRCFSIILRNQCMFSFWHIKADKLASALSNSNFHPKSTMIESTVFADLGLGNWRSCAEGIVEGADWARKPWEAVVTTTLEQIAPELAAEISGKSAKTEMQDAVIGQHTLLCGSATELSSIKTSSVDCVVTDPPFGGLLHYSELSNFFYVWLRLALRTKYPDLFEPEYVPTALEAVANRARQPDDADAFYQRILTDCWREAYRVLKPGGILAFTFHHSEDEPWVGVLESLFDAGFYLEATYPIRSDETKGEGAAPGTFGSQTSNTTSSTFAASE